MKLKEITFVLENCEQITIDGKYIGDFLVEDIHTSIKRIACNAINKIDVAYTFAIEIHKDANKEMCSFGLKELPFSRLMLYNDITSIHFILESEHAEEGQEPTVENYDYYVNWIGESDNVNEAQDSYISNVGNLYVVIADGKTVYDFFDKENIDDEEYMDFICSMYDIGDKYSTRTYD